jgi:hypothetical protein
MLADLLALHGIIASSIGASNFLLLAYFVMNLHDGSIHAFLSTILALVISVGAVILQMFV